MTYGRGLGSIEASPRLTLAERSSDRAPIDRQYGRLTRRWPMSRERLREGRENKLTKLATPSTM